MGRKFFDFKGIIVCITLLINFTSISVSQINIDPTKFELSNASSSKIAPSYNSSENYFILTTKNKRQTGAIWYNKNKNIIAGIVIILTNCSMFGFACPPK